MVNRQFVDKPNHSNLSRGLCNSWRYSLQMWRNIYEILYSIYKDASILLIVATVNGSNAISKEYLHVKWPP